MVAKLFNHNFAWMLFKSNYINKAISAASLVLLLFIHSIKLLHAHAGDNFSPNSFCGSKNSDTNDHSKTVRSFSDCSICSYQLGKDADDLSYNGCNDCKPEQNIFNTDLISFLKLSFHSAFENRGPPSVI